jgi:hypothetical protein
MPLRERPPLTLYFKKKYKMDGLLKILRWAFWIVRDFLLRGVRFFFWERQFDLQNYAGHFER